MKSAKFLCIYFLILIFSFSTLTYAGVPQMINYQGKITKPTGALVDTTISMTFAIYSDSIGTDSVWSEMQSSVVVQKGIFSVLLGSVALIPDSIFDGSVRYLGVKVGSDPEMSPRKAMVSVAYALRAGTADGGGGGSDNDWTLRITDTADTTLMTGGEWGISRYGNVLWGSADSTHVNLGVACTTGYPGYNIKYCTVGGGRRNKATSDRATVAGGRDNTASSYSATVAGGDGNTASDVHAAVGGGFLNTASNTGATIGGGEYNNASGQFTSIGGGYKNTASGHYSTVGGGAYNFASALRATVPGGFADSAAGDYSLAAGFKVRIAPEGDYTFAFGRDFTTSIPNAVIFHNSVDPIKVGIGTTAPDEELHVQGKIKMVDGNQAAGKVLTSDANGVGTWQATGNIGGNGTANYIPKFTDSTTLGNSVIYETGGRIGIGTTTPISDSKLHVQTDDRYAGFFTSSDFYAHVIHSEYTGAGSYLATAVYGKSTPLDYRGFGGYFEGGYMGVHAEVNPTGSEWYYGVHSEVYGGSGTNYALYGRVNGTNLNYGVRGEALGSGSNRGVFGWASGGISNWSGYFLGDVWVTGTLTKGGGSFQIDHPLDPENKYLFHSFVESPDMMNVYNGNVILDATGEATVELPTYFEALNREFRYQLTCIGRFAPVFIAQKISGNQFTIAGGEPGMEVSWQVTGIRHDKFAEAKRIQVEVDKSDNERGKYLHPEAYNLGEEYGIHYDEQQKHMKERMEKEKLD